MLASLQQRFIAFRYPRALRVGIAANMVARGMTGEEVSSFLTWYCRSTPYLKACSRAGATRFDLDYQPCGSVSGDEAAWARDRLHEVKDAKAAKKGRKA
jgi:sRNA-binding protein